LARLGGTAEAVPCPRPILATSSKMIGIFMAKHIVRTAIKVVATIAAVVLLLVPTGLFYGLVLFVGSIVALLVCLFLWLFLFGNENTGFWPNDRGL
jgi:hypothetical protein